MTTVSRTISGIGRVGVITLGFLFTPGLTVAGHPLTGAVLCSLLTCGVMTVIDRLISS